MTLLWSSSSDRKSKTRTVGRNYQSSVVMIIITLVMLGGMGSRLAYLQLIQGERNRDLADNNRIRVIPKQPERGNIFDRKGRILASSRLSRSVYLWPLAHKQKSWPTTRKRLSEILEIPEADIQKRIEQVGENNPTLVRIERDISPEKIVALEESQNQLQGVEVDIEPARVYPNGQVAAHVLGYTGEMNHVDLDKAKRTSNDYRLGDVMGKMGVEAAFEKTLRGTWGGQQVEVDGKNRILRILGDKASEPGENVHLTIDLDLQKAAEAALGSDRGAIVAMNPNNGAILAMVSRPAFDPNLFTRRISQKEWQRLQKLNHPFVNRAIQAFPPASTFKIVTTTAAI